jgi:hypothetical protein
VPPGADKGLDDDRLLAGVTNAGGIIRFDLGS